MIELLEEWAIGVVISAVEEGRHAVEDEIAKKRQVVLCNKVSALILDIGGRGARALSIAREALALNKKCTVMKMYTLHNLFFQSVEYCM